ncbi:MAG: hypothetical protein IKX67_07380 [Bacteroidales bacterium]|nr:hypothetical protein [Bacteroidales bacterium]
MRSDYDQMIAKLNLIKQNASGFHALSYSKLDEVNKAYQSEEGKKMLRNSYKVFFALEDLEKKLEPIEE